jgi:hypothetical protein
MDNLLIAELEAQVHAMTDPELERVADRLRKRAELQSALSLADLSVARYEQPSEAVDRAMDRNLMASSRISLMQRIVRKETEARKASQLSRNRRDAS